MSHMARALITGATGQDGVYLARLLLDKGCEVFAAHRRNSTLSTWRLDEFGITSLVRFAPCELLEITNILRLVDSVRPDELYNLAAQSFVAVSFGQPLYTGDVTGLGGMRILEALRALGGPAHCYQASTSEMYGNSRDCPQSEQTPFVPTSPYANAKLYAHWSTVMYRKAYGIHASCGIAFNHESPLRGPEFVTQKIVRGLVGQAGGALVRRSAHGGGVPLAASAGKPPRAGAPGGAGAPRPAGRLAGRRRLSRHRRVGSWHGHGARSPGLWSAIAPFAATVRAAGVRSPCRPRSRACRLHTASHSTPLRPHGTIHGGAPGAPPP
jgi:NAD(P)-dependent dehydrogenase (short-subunit alcohol dehydrogenase family)